MDERLYEKVLDVLVLGHLRYKDSYEKLNVDEEIVLDYGLRSDYSIEDYLGVIREFINWHKTYENKKE